jgi:hypothetical protein
MGRYDDTIRKVKDAEKNRFHPGESPKERQYASHGSNSNGSGAGAER